MKSVNNAGQIDLQWFGRERGYVSPLLSNLAVDYSTKIREGLVGPLIFPRFPVDKPSGKYAYYAAEDAYKVPDVTMAGERSRANEFAASATMKPYATEPFALKAFIDKADLEKMDGPFNLWERRKTELIVSKLELAQEKRIADAIYRLSGRSNTLSGGSKWANGGGDPFSDFQTAIGKLFFRPNLVLMQESVFDAIEYHPKLLEKLGEANMIKKVSETTLAQLFRIDRVIIARGRADFTKRNAEKGLTLSGIWGNNVVFGYTSEAWDEPCSGKTITVKYAEADNQGYIVRTWDEEDGGLLGGEYVQVGHDVTELTVAPELLWTIKDVL